MVGLRMAVEEHLVGLSAQETVHALRNLLVWVLAEIERSEGMAERIIINIAEDGATEIKVEGCAGPACQKLTAGLERALGKTVKEEKTREFHQHATVKDHVVNKA